MDRVMQRDLWILPHHLNLTVRLRNVPCGIYRELARRAVTHRTPFILFNGEWVQAHPESYLRVIRRLAGGEIVTFVFDPDGECEYLDTPEHGVEFYYSGPTVPEEMAARILVNVAEMLKWPVEETGHAG